MFKKILVPTDFSAFSEDALRYAAALAKISGGSIECVHVIDMTFLSADMPSGVYSSVTDIKGTLKSLRTRSRKELEFFVEKEHVQGIDVKAHLREGIAADEIVKLSNEIHADLIVIPTHGRSGLDKMVFGSTCERVLRTAALPVLALKPEGPGVGRDGSLTVKRILCPIDFSSFSESSLPLARTFAKHFGATIVLAHIVDTRFDYPEWAAEVALNNSPALLKAAKEHVDRVAAGMSDVKAEVYVGSGAPARMLVDLTGKADLVIMPTHARKGIAHLLLGSVTERVTRGSHCPVLTVRPKA